MQDGKLPSLSNIALFDFICFAKSMIHSLLLEEHRFIHLYTRISISQVFKL